MPVYKDNNAKTWYCKFYYVDYMGRKKGTTKRGFKTKKEALEWEREFKTFSQREITMLFGAFVEVYFDDKKNELKERSIRNKRYMIKTHVLPYFENKRVNEILPSDIIQWQNSVMEKGYSQTYLRMIQNQLTAIFTHAYNIYGLSSNPCKKVKKMGKSDADKLNFWTRGEYDCFINTFEKEDKYHVIFEILFWTGCRIGELLALTLQDIDFDLNKIYISKTYYRVNGKDIVTSPKTNQSIRTIDIPEFLKEEIKDYTSRLYKWGNSQRIFQIVAESVQHKMKRHIEKAGVKKIRVHDLRHSHVAYLIYEGVQPLIIKERLGHRDIKITLNTYGHLYPSEQKKLAEFLNNLR